MQRGGGTDQDAVQRGQQAVAKELEAIKVSYNPRYGAFDVQQGFLRSTASPPPATDRGSRGGT